LPALISCRAPGLNLSNIFCNKEKSLWISYSLSQVENNCARTSEGDIWERTTLNKCVYQRSWLEVFLCARAALEFLMPSGAHFYAREWKTSQFLIYTQNAEAEKTNDTSPVKLKCKNANFFRSALLSQHIKTIFASSNYFEERELFALFIHTISTNSMLLCL